MNQTTTATNPLGYERIGKLLRSYAIPSIISLIINSLYNMVDQIFIGQGVGFLGNGATNIIAQITMIAIAIGSLFGDGLAAFFSLNGLQMCASVLFQAIGQPVKAAITSLSKQLIFYVPAMLILSYFFGLTGLLAAGPTADALAFILAGGFSFKVLKDMEKKEKEIGGPAL